MRFARAASLLGAFGMAAAAALVVTADEAAAKQGASLSVSPSSGPAGSGFTITFRNFGRNCPEIRFDWDDQRLATAPGQANGSVQVTVPRTARTGPHIVTGRGCHSVARDLYLVVPGSAPTATAPSPVPTVPTTPPPTTTRPPTTKQTTTTTTTTTTSTTTTTASSSTRTELGRLTFDKPAIQAGEPLSASGTGCEPNAPVSLNANGERVGATTADAQGAFSTPVEFSRIKPGRQLVTATCGSTVLTGSVDLTLATSASGSTGVLVVFVLVLLAGVTLIAHNRTKARW